MQFYLSWCSWHLTYILLPKLSLAVAQPQLYCINIVTISSIMMWRHQCEKLHSSKIMLKALCSRLRSDSSVGRLPRLTCQQACSLVSFVCDVCSCLNISGSCCQCSCLSWQSRIRAPHEVLVLKRASWDLGVLGYLSLLGKHALHIHSDRVCHASFLAAQLSIAAVAA
ncbi:unnamed protein product [Effrenium voratum]|uniref:Secreted protein n=1 Tax=Effrenium voratum TaxID=2562239 RepID=A0AA36JET8_9DINO|nr:unnamed protein product [Effrenium voratum]